MKKLVLYTFAALFLVVSCRKSDNDKLPPLERVPLPQLVKVASTDQSIAAQDPDAFNAKFTVGLQFTSDTKPKKMDIVVIKNGDLTKIKALQSDITTFPSTISFTGVMIKSLFGKSSILGDSYTIGVNITTQDGKVFPAFSSVATTNGSGVTSIPNSSPEITYAALCKFSMTDFGAIGSKVPFTVLEDGWNDYPKGATIPVTIIDDTHMSFEYASDDPKPIIITIDPNTNTTSVDKVDFGNYGTPPDWTYGEIYAASVPNNPNNQVAPCDLTVSVELNFTVAAGSFGNAQFEIKKK